MKICMLGGSNSITKDGLKLGFEKALEKMGGGVLLNYALGSSTSSQNLFELIRHRDEIAKCDLIISDTLVNELSNHYGKPKTSLNTIHQNIKYFYNELSKFKTKVVILLLPTTLEARHNDSNLIVNMHVYYANLYDFYVLNIHEYYIKHKLIEFGDIYGAHQLSSILRKIAENIILNYNKIIIKSKPSIDNSIIYKIVYAKDLNKDTFQIKNSIFCEEVIKISGDDTFSLCKYKGYFLIGILSWNHDELLTNSVYETYSSIIIENNSYTLIKPAAHLLQFNDIKDSFLIDNDTIMKFNKYNLPPSEHGVVDYVKNIDFFNFSAMLLVNKIENLDISYLTNMFKDKIIANNSLDNSCLCDIDLIADAIFEHLEKIENPKKIVEIAKINNKINRICDIFLLNVSKGKKASQSSFYKTSGKADDVLNDCNREHAFHTLDDENPWWQVDLGEIYPLRYIYIENRRINCKNRAKTLYAEISIDGKEYIKISNEKLNWNNLDSIDIILDNIPARYLRLALSEKQFLHLASVQVYTQKDIKNNLSEKHREILKLIHNQNKIIENLLTE